MGKYGMMRRKYLEESRQGLYTRLILSGKLMEHLQEIDETCRRRMDKSAALMDGALCSHLYQTQFSLIPKVSVTEPTLVN